MKKLSRYFWNVLISIDQFFNTIFGGNPDETISSRAGKARKTSKLANGLCIVLDVFDPNHCEKSIEHDEN